MNIIETEKLTRRFRRVTALQELSFTVPEGSICAVLGPNGAGKTTLIETVLNLLEPSSGQARVLGVDSRALGPAQLSRIGYVSENQKVEDGIQVGAMLKLCSDLYASWDAALAQDLTKRFELSLDRRFKELSRGMKLRALFVAALSYRPALLLLDEPFSGLDPLIRDELVRTVIDLAQETGATVLLSSHDVDEVERLADRVLFLDNGRLGLCEDVETLKARHQKVVARIDPLQAEGFRKQAAWIGCEQEGALVSYVDTQVGGAALATRERVFGQGAVITAQGLSLKEIYLAHARAQKQGRV